MKLSMWKENRKDKLNYVFVGFATGIFLSINTLLLTVIPLLYGVTIAYIGAVFVFIATISLTILLVLTVFFGYKDLKSVIKNAIFKWSTLAGLFAGIVILAIAILKTYTSPL
ncbi:MAG: hypothetical protein HYV47_03035 [Candidatus Nealsonbacteria bacterium]|nr:hypothetical protein [Candidatus Nealsonbacteria bacterium]